VVKRGIEMSNLWFNIRFGTYHWQWGRDGMTFKQNSTQVAWREKEPETWKWFAVYCVFGIHL
jgi:hypothetical protein